MRSAWGAKADVRHALRVLTSQWLATCLAVLCLGLAIGTNATVFTFVNGLLLRPLPLADTDRLVSLHEVRREAPGTLAPVSAPNVRDWQSAVGDLARIAVQRPVRARVSERGAPERVAAALVSANFFPVLGVEPARGRGFQDGDGHLGAPPTVLISHALWQQRYAQSPDILGHAITVNGMSHTIVGVMPAALSHIALRRGLLGAVDLWMPLPPAGDEPRDRRDLRVVARLAPGVSPEALRARLEGVAQALELSLPAESQGWTVGVRPLAATFSSTTRTMLLMASGAVACILLIACANVANLTLARAAGRRRDMATRLALGAPRWHIVRQLLSESLLVGIASMPLGIAVAYGGRTLLLASADSADMATSLPIDGRVLLFSLALALLASVLAGLLPALHVIGRVRHDVLTAGGRSDATTPPPHARLSRALIVGEVALAVIMLVGASLFVRSFQRLLVADGSFDTARILTVVVDLDRGVAESADVVSRRVGDLVDQLAGHPMVTGAAAATFTPLRDAGVSTAVIADSFAGRDDEAPSVLLGGITPALFDVLDVPMRQGRAFSDAEGRSLSAVAIVNHALAERFWPGQSAVGRRFRRVGDAGATWFTVVGVSNDILSWDVSNRPLPTAYLPYAYVPASESRVLLRTSSDPSRVAETIRSTVHAADASITVVAVRTMTDVHYLVLSRNQTLARLFAALGGIALLLGAAGVYGVLSYFVSQRTHEIGVRAALGADRRTLIGFFMRQGMALILIGIALGAGGAWAMARVVRGQLHDVSPADPLSFGGVAILMGAVGLAATYIPARRAARVDPMSAIRD